MGEKTDPFPFFNGTDVPRKALFDHLEEGGTLESFVAKFPAVTWEYARAVLYMAEEQCQKLANERRQFIGLYAAYLESVTDPEPLDEEFATAVEALIGAAGDEQAFERVMAERGFSYLTEESIDEMVAEAKQQAAASQTPPQRPEG